MLIAQTDVYITSNAKENLQRVSWAEKYEVETASGFSIPLFEKAVE